MPGSAAPLSSLPSSFPHCLKRFILLALRVTGRRPGGCRRRLVRPRSIRRSAMRPSRLQWSCQIEGRRQSCTIHMFTDAGHADAGAACPRRRTGGCVIGKRLLPQASPPASTSGLPRPALSPGEERSIRCSALEGPPGREDRRKGVGSDVTELPARDQGFPLHVVGTFPAESQQKEGHSRVLAATAPGRAQLLHHPHLALVRLELERSKVDLLPASTTGEGIPHWSRLAARAFGHDDVDPGQGACGRGRSDER